MTFLSGLSVLTGRPTALGLSAGVCTGMSGTLKRSPCWKRSTSTPDTTGGRIWIVTSLCSSSRNPYRLATIFTLCACQTSRQQPGQHQGLCCDFASVLDLGAWHTFTGYKIHGLNAKVLFFARFLSVGLWEIELAIRRLLDAVRANSHGVPLFL